MELLFTMMLRGKFFWVPIEKFCSKGGTLTDVTHNLNIGCVKFRLFDAKSLIRLVQNLLFHNVHLLLNLSRRYSVLCKKNSIVLKS